MTTVSGAHPDMRIDVVPERSRVCVAPAGELDLATVPELARTIDELRAVGFSDFKLDLRQLTFMDSSGLRYLLGLSRDSAVQLHITYASGAVQRLFELAGVLEVLPLTAPARTGSPAGSRRSPA